MSSARSVLLFGANGQLGRRLSVALTEQGYEVTALDRAACDFATVDAKKIEVLMRAVEPALVIIAAAYTEVDRAESQPELAARINGEVPGWIAQAARAHGAPCIHFSTDYVFDGARGPYRPDAPTRPLNVYGTSKRQGEEAVRRESGYVFRLQWLVDTQGKNFLMTMRRLLAERPEISVVADQIGAPSTVPDVATAIVAAVPLILAGTLPPDIYHLTAGGYTSWHGFACAIADAIGSATRIIPITTAQYPLPATRPEDGRLDCSALAGYGIRMPHWRAGLLALLRGANDNA